MHVFLNVELRARYLSATEDFIRTGEETVECGRGTVPLIGFARTKTADSQKASHDGHAYQIKAKITAN